MADTGLPKPPKIGEDEIAACRASGDFRDVAFEWYKHVGLLAVGFAAV